MSLFADMDLDNAPDDPNAIPDATYKAYLTTVEVKPQKKDPAKRNIVFTYQIAEGEDAAGAKVREYKSFNKDDDDRTKGYLKQRLISLGVPKDRINDVGVEDLIGTEVYVTTATNDGFTNVRRVVRTDAAEGGTIGTVDPDNPFGL